MAYTPNPHNHQLNPPLHQSNGMDHNNIDSSITQTDPSSVVRDAYPELCRSAPNSTEPQMLSYDNSNPVTNRHQKSLSENLSEFHSKNPLAADHQSSLLMEPYSDNSALMQANNDIFSSDYMDTISSINSAQFLIKPDTDDEVVTSDENMKEIYFNLGYVSGSTTEPPDKDVTEMSTSDDEEEKEYSPLLEHNNLLPSEIKQEKENDEINNPGSLRNLEEFVHHHLIPIAENEVLCVEIEEIQSIAAASASYVPPVSHHGKIASKITVADESFLLKSQTSLTDLDKTDKKKAATMQNLHERNSFLDLTNMARMGKACHKGLIYLKDDLTFGSLASLNTIAARNLKDPTQIASLAEDPKVLNVIPSGKHRRNVLALSFSITLYFIAMGSVRNLQSSLNQEGGVGIISMAVSFLGYMIGSIFSAPIVLSFQPRKCIIINLIPNLVYIAANIYPTVWLMAPVSLIQGISLAIIWNAMSTYITFLSRGRSMKKGENFEKVSSNFFGIFCLIYQSYHIIGNLIASLVLMPRSKPVPIVNNATYIANMTNITDAGIQGSRNLVLFEPGSPFPVAFAEEYIPEANDNTTLLNINHLQLCGAEFCNHFEIKGSGVTVSDETKYLLLGIYMGCILVAMAIAGFLLEPLNPRLFHSTESNMKRLKKQLISLGKFSLNGKFLLIFPLLMYSIMQFGFITGEVTMAFVTCPIGIHMVGYTMICFGVCASTSSYFSGLLCRYTGRISHIVLAAALNLGVLVFMLKWQPTLDSLVPYFIIMGLWGVSDGIWNCQVNSLVGVVFSDQYEEAYAGLRVAQGFGVAILFSYSSSVCMATKIYIIGGVIIISMLLYAVMEGMLRCAARPKMYEIKQTTV